MNEPIRGRLVIFDSAPNDIEGVDRLVLAFEGGQFWREDWAEGEFYRIVLTPFEALELVEMVGHP